MPVIGFLQLGPIASATVCDTLVGDLGYKQLTAQDILQRPKNQCNAFAQRDIEASHRWISNRLHTRFFICLARLTYEYWLITRLFDP